MFKIDEPSLNETMSPEIKSEIVCKNCETKGEGNFCTTCGQTLAIRRITFKETISDFMSSTFSLEGPLLYTIKMLLVNPGKMLREFLDGRRKAYYKPVSFFVLATVVYILVRTLIDYDPLGGESTPETKDYPEYARRMTEAARFMVTNISNVMLFLVFALGILQKIFFYKKYNLAEYTSIGFYISGIYTIIGMFLMLVIHYLYPIPKQTQLVFLVVFVIYVMYSLHQQLSFLSVLKYVLVALLSLLFYIILGFGFSYLVVSLR